MDPTNPNVIYVGFWERKRTAWNLDSGGPNGGIFKTTDGGKTFKKLTKGLPTGKTGKIGLAIARSNPKVVMAHVEAEFQPAPNSPDFNDMTKIGAGIYRSEDGGETWTFVNRYNRRPFYYNHVAISPFNDKETYPLQHLLRSHDRRREDVHPDRARRRRWWRRRRRPAVHGAGRQRHALLARHLARSAQQEAVLGRQRRRPGADA